MKAKLITAEMLGPVATDQDRAEVSRMMDKLGWHADGTGRYLNYREGDEDEMQRDWEQSLALCIAELPTF